MFLSRILFEDWDWDWSLLDKFLKMRFLNDYGSPGSIQSDPKDVLISVNLHSENFEFKLNAFADQYFLKYQNSAVITLKSVIV